jgi:hypothetical protein
MFPHARSGNNRRRGKAANSGQFSWNMGKVIVKIKLTEESR